MSAEVVVVIGTAIAVVASILAWAYATANRLDRLHVRTDLARLSLVESLSRRHVVAASVIRELGSSHPDITTGIDAALEQARGHRPENFARADPMPDPDPRRRSAALAPGNDPVAEHAENALGLALARVDLTALSTELRAELDDARERVDIARRFHNDAVRDTRALREQPLVRWFRLAGRAPMPDYVELVDSLTGR